MTLEEIFAYNAPYNKNNITALIDKIRNNVIVPYLGAGMSILSKNIYPTWGNFLNSTAHNFNLANDKFAFKSYEEQADFLYDIAT